MTCVGVTNYDSHKIWTCHNFVFCNLPLQCTGESMQKLLASPEHCLHLVNTSQSSRKFNNLPASSDKGSMQRIIQSGLITEVTGVCVCAVLLLSPLSVIDLPNSDQYSQIFQLQSISCPPITFSSGHPHSTSGRLFSSSVI